MPEGIAQEDPKSGNDDEQKILQMLRGGFDTTHVLERRARVTDSDVEHAANADEHEANAGEHEANADEHEANAGEQAANADDQA